MGQPAVEAHPAAPAPDRVSTWLLRLGFGLAVCVVLLWVGDGLTFFEDEWALVLRDPSWTADALLDPVNEHIALGPALVYKVSLGIFGTDAAAVRAATALLLAIVVLLVFEHVRERLGVAVAAIVSVVLALLGPAWQNLLWPAAMGFLGALAGGIAGLRCLSARTRRGDVAAAALLTAGVAFMTLGLMFVVAAAVLVAVGAARGRDRLARLWVPAVPAVAYFAWYLAYGREAQTGFGFDDLTKAPSYVVDTFATALASLTGLSGINPDSLGVSTAAGLPILVAVVAVVLWIAWREPERLSPLFWALLAGAVAFAISVSLNVGPGRVPGASRYQIVGAVFVVMIGAELLRGKRLPRGWTVALAVVAAGVVLSNLGALRAGQASLREATALTLPELAALDVGRQAIAPEAVIEPGPSSPFPSAVSASRYFDVVDRHGSAADGFELPGDAVEDGRAAADSMLATALGLTLAPGVAEGAGACARRELGGAGEPLEAALPPGGATIATDAPLGDLSLRRWATATAPVDLGPVAPPGATLEIPVDGSDTPWQARIVSGAGGAIVKICALG